MAPTINYTTLPEIGGMRQIAQGMIAKCSREFESLPKTQRESPKAKAQQLQLQIAQAILAKKLEFMELSPLNSGKAVHDHNAERLQRLEELLCNIKGL